MFAAIMSRLATRIYAIVALAVILTAVTSEVLVGLAVENAYAMREKHLSDVVDTAVGTLAGLEARVAAGDLTRDEAIARGRRALTDLRYGGGEYFFAFDTNNIYQVHPSHPEWIGTDQSGFTDVKGTRLFAAMGALVAREGRGAITYYFTKPGSDTPEPKLSYVRLFEPWGWIVGTGSYVSDIQQSLAHLRFVGLAILLASLLALLVLSTLLVRSVTRPLASLRGRMQTLAQGETVAPVPYAGKPGEIGDMARAVGVFRDALVAREALERSQAEKDAEIQRHREQAAAREQEARAREARDTEARHAAEARAQAEKEARRAEAEADRMAVHREQSEVMQALATGLEAISRGDLSVRLDTAFPEAYEQLRADFNDAIAKFAALVAGIVEGTVTITQQTDVLNGAALDMSRRTERQAASLTETAAALSQLSEAVTMSTEGAREASRAVTQTREQSALGREVVQQTVAAMSDIAQSSGQISSITSVIDDIAFQTNLLALNAGVEAARAGESGRGFAVVASEVRALAQRSSEAAREIAQLIETSGTQVQDGVRLVNESGTALGAIETLVAKLDTLVQNIASSSETQASGLSDVSVAVGELDEVTQQNAAMFEETTAAVQTLRSQTALLERDTAQLKLDDGAGGEALRRAS